MQTSKVQLLVMQAEETSCQQGLLLPRMNLYQQRMQLAKIPRNPRIRNQRNRTRLTRVTRRKWRRMRRKRKKEKRRKRKMILSRWFDKMAATMIKMTMIALMTSYQAWMSSWPFPVARNQRRGPPQWRALHRKNHPRRRWMRTRRLG